MATRRQLLLATASSALGVRLAFAQSRPVVGILAPVPRVQSVVTPLLLERLAELGYRDGATMSVEYRYAARPDLASAEVRALLERKCDLIFAVGTEANARALREATSSVPVVLIAFEYDPVESGIVASFARPGRNITGVYVPVPALVGKRVEIAHEIMPTASRYLVLADRFSGTQVPSMREAADARGLQLTVVEFAQSPYDLAGAFEAGRKAGVNGVFLLLSPELFARRKEISELLGRHRLPGFAPGVMAHDAGMLASYTVDSPNFIRRAAEMGERILKGAKASNIPLEQPGEYSIVINLTTARALGIKVPYSVLSRATKVIE
jgi:putative ABC transport system substrate-binding protein